MIQNDQAQTAMAREIREIPLATERLLAAHDLVATVAHRIRHANPRVVVISGRGSSGNAGTFLRYLFEARAGLLVFDVRSLSRDNLQTIDRYAERRFHRHIAIRSQSRSCDWSAIGQKKWSTDDCNCKRCDIARCPGLRIDAAGWCWPRAFSRGYKICCTVDGHKWATNCVADLRSCLERKDQTTPAKVQSRAYLRLVSVERQLRSSTRCVRNWAGIWIGNGARDRA